MASYDKLYNLACHVLQHLVLVMSINCHFVPNCIILEPHSGVPNQLMRRNNQTAHVEPQMVPELSDAVQQLPKEKLIFSAQYPDFGPFFHSVVNGDHSSFKFHSNQ